MLRRPHVLLQALQEKVQEGLELASPRAKMFQQPGQGKAHEEAHRLEHAISNDLENKINDRLNNPTTCPFGHPIPGNSYSPEGNIIPLNQAKTGTEYNIDRIPDEERPLLEYLVKTGFIPNQTIVVKDLAPYRGIINILCNDIEITVSYDVASRIWVRL